MCRAWCKISMPKWSSRVALICWMRGSEFQHLPAVEDDVVVLAGGKPSSYWLCSRNGVSGQGQPPGTVQWCCTGSHGSPWHRAASSSPTGCPRRNAPGRVDLLEHSEALGVLRCPPSARKASRRSRTSSSKPACRISHAGPCTRRIIRREVGEDDVCSGAANGPKDLRHASLGVQEAGCHRLDGAYSPLTL